MKFNLLKIFGSCAVAIFLGINCYADELPDVTYKYVDSSVIISGEAVEGETIISLQILKKDKVFDTPFIDENVLFCDQQKPIEGKYSFEIEYDCEPGEYAVRVSSDKKIKNTFNIEIVSYTDIRDAYDELNTSAETDDFDSFVNIINTKRDELNFKFSLSDGKTLGNELQNYFQFVKTSPLSLENENENAEKFKSFVTAAMLKGEQVDNIDSVISEIYIADSRILTDYNALVKTDGVQQYFTQKLSGKDAVDLPAFEKNLKETLILTGVRYSDGAGTIRGLLNNYGSDFDIDSNASDVVYRQISGLDFASINELKKKIEELVGGNTPGNGGAGGGTGGGGGAPGGTVGSFNDNYTIEVTGSKDVAKDTVKVSFEDLDSVMWASEAILALADKGIVNGKGDKMFAPEDTITREEFAKILVNVMKLDQGQNISNSFNDVNENEWYFRYVNIAKDAGVLSGIGDGKFGVGASITREDMVVMLHNALKKKSVKMSSENVKFEDAAEISDYAIQAVAALYNLGAVNGVSETRFMPKETATRAQAAKVVYGVLELLQ